jgi:hypothetical protein
MGCGGCLGGFSRKKTNFHFKRPKKKNKKKKKKNQAIEQKLRGEFDASIERDGGVGLVICGLACFEDWW